MVAYRGSANITDMVFINVCTFRHGFTAMTAGVRPFSGFMDTYCGSANITDMVFVTICTFRHGFTAIVTGMRPFSGFMVAYSETTFITGVIPIGIFTTACTIRTTDVTGMITVAGLVSAEPLTICFPFGIKGLFAPGSSRNLLYQDSFFHIGIPANEIVAFTYRKRQLCKTIFRRVKQRKFLQKCSARKLVNH